MDIAIDLIKPSPYQPRLFFDVDDLKREIEADGLLSALVVRKCDEYYELLDGERRWRALKESGWKTVPVDVREVDDTTARRSAYKLNTIRANYKTEETARYFKKLAGEGMTFYEIGKELNVDDNWVLAHTNIFKFPEDIQNAVFTPGTGLTVSHIQELEPIIGTSIEDATTVAREIINRRLTTDETRKLLKPRMEAIEVARIEAAKEILGVATPKIELKAPEDLEKAAEALRREAQRQREEAMTPEERAALEAEKKAKAEAQAAAKALREQETKERKDEEERRRQERAEKKARVELRGNKAFVQEALKAMPQAERLEMLDLVPSLEKPKEPKGLSEQFQEVIKEASQLVSRIERLRANPGFYELDLKPFALDLHILAAAFTELTQQIGGNHE